MAWGNASLYLAGGAMAFWGLWAGASPRPAAAGPIALLAQSPPPDYTKGALSIGVAGILTASIPVFSMIFQDIKDRRAERRADRKLEDRLAEAERLRAVDRDELASVVKQLETSRENWHAERASLNGKLLDFEADRLGFEADKKNLEAELRGIREALKALGVEHADAINANSEGVRALAGRSGAAGVPSAPHLDPPTMQGDAR